MTTISPSTAAFYTAAASTMSDLRGQMASLNTQIATGNKLTNAWDDPAAAAAMRTLQLQDAEAGVYKSNADTATANLSLADSTLSQVVNSVQRATELATQAANGTLSASDRSAIAVELQQIKANLVSLANSRDSAGNALFGGAASGQAYTTDATGHVTYAGTATANTVALGPNASVIDGVTGTQVFSFASGGATTDLFSVVSALATSLGDSTTTSSAAQTAAHSALDGLKAGLDAVTGAQTVVGARMAWVQLTTQNETAARTTRQQNESNIGNTDIGTAYTQLQNLSVVLQAAQSSFTQMSNLTLFNYMKA